MKLELKKHLNEILANLVILDMKLHHFHWFVNGETFFTLHEKFEELYNEVSGHIDDIAERLLTLSHKPISTLKECLNIGTIEEAKETDAKGMVSTLIDDLLVIDKQLKTGIEKADQIGDEGTADLLIGMSTSFEKHVWMLKAFLGK